MTRFEAYKKKITVDHFAKMLSSGDIDCKDCPLYNTERCDNFLCFSPNSWKIWLNEEVEDEDTIEF